jgi:hypothetical protein
VLVLSRLEICRWTGLCLSKPERSNLRRRTRLWFCRQAHQPHLADAAMAELTEISRNHYISPLGFAELYAHLDSD